MEELGNELNILKDLKSITKNARESRNVEFNNRITIGREDAILHITNNAVNLMKESAINGKDRAIIYTFNWVKSPTDTHDSDGNKTVFKGNIRLLDLVTKGKIDFLNDLNKYFNNFSENNEYHCGVYKTKDNKWNIYVSWSDKPDREEDYYNKDDYLYKGLTKDEYMANQYRKQKKHKRTFKI